MKNDVVLSIGALVCMGASMSSNPDVPPLVSEVLGTAGSSTVVGSAQVDVHAVEAVGAPCDSVRQGWSQQNDQVHAQMAKLQTGSAYRKASGTLSGGTGVMEDPGGGVHILYALPSGIGGDIGTGRPKLVDSGKGDVYVAAVDDSAGALVCPDTGIREGEGNGASGCCSTICRPFGRGEEIPFMRGDAPRLLKTVPEVPGASVTDSVPPRTNSSDPNLAFHARSPPTRTSGMLRSIFLKDRS